VEHGGNMKKVVKLTESDINRIVKKTINESIKMENYMFFQNLKEIKDNIESIMEMDKYEIDRLLSNGHDWASEHMATAKDDIEEVASFLKHRK
jgi:hypothetical protein